MSESINVRAIVRRGLVRALDLWEAMFIAANTPMGELFKTGWARVASRWRAPQPTAAAIPSPQPETAPEEEPERPPVLAAFPYLYSVLSRGVLNLLLLPEEMTDDELIELARVQITANRTSGSLLLGPDRCVFFDPDGSATFHPLPPRCWRVETGVLRPPFHLDISEARRGLATAYVAALHERAGHGWGDRERGGEETTG